MNDIAVFTNFQFSNWVCFKDKSWHKLKAEATNRINDLDYNLWLDFRHTFYHFLSSPSLTNFIFWGGNGEW